VTRLGVTFAAGAGTVAVLVTAVLAQDNGGLTYASTTWALTLAYAAAALSLFGAAPLASSRSLGLLVSAAGASWLAPVVVAWPAGPPLVRAVATLAAAFALPLLAHAALAAPSGRLAGRLACGAVAAAYAWSAFAAITLALVRDPFYDPTCSVDCDHNAFLAWSRPGLSEALVRARPWVELALGVAFVALAVLIATRVRASGLALGALGAVAILHGLRVAGTPYEDPQNSAFQGIFLAGCGAVLLTAFAVGVPRLLVSVRRRAVTRVVSALDDAPAPLELEQKLADALGDPGLRVVFWLPELGRSVDVRGAPCAVPADAGGRAVTPLVRGGHIIAWIEHAAGNDELGLALTAAVRLAVDNARLRAGLLAQVADLHEARRRIVADGDDERRRLERDLHDGLQQQLLALGGGLRTAAAGARAVDDPAATPLEQAVVETAGVLEEVRAVAHGIFPAILTDAGLGAAVVSLADVAALPVAVHRLPQERYPAEAETAAYHVVAEAVANAAAHSGATVVDVDVSFQNGALCVRVHDDGRGGAKVERVGGLAELSDRVGAIEGTISIESGAESGTTIGAMIPCVS
jgi:signal transduction histidine kinase